MSLDQDSFFRDLAVRNGAQDSIEAIASVMTNLLQHLGFSVIIILFDSTGTAVDSEAIPTGGYSLDQFDMYDAVAGFPETTGFY